jgi:RHS repeat-associated protein
MLVRYRRCALLGRPLTITHPISGTVGYRYDTQGNRTALIYPDGKRVDYSYDRLGRLRNVTDWASQVVTYTYNVAGSLVKTELPNGVVSTYEYDDAGQLLHLLHHKNGQGMSLFSSRYDYLYDNVGNRRMATETLFTPYRVHFPAVMKSEEGGGQAMMAAPGGAEALSSGVPTDPYPAPEGELPIEVPGVLSPLATPLPVEEAYPLPESELPAMDSQDSAYPAPVDGVEGSGTSFWQGIVAFFSNLFGWLSPASTAHAAPAQAGPAALVQTQVLSSEGERQVVIAYTYDPLNRLTAADYSDGPYFHYTYDSAGNRLTQTVPTGTTNYTYDHANRLSNAGGVTYVWDNNGNLLWDGVYTYTYSSANRLVSVTGGQSPAVNYTYGGLGDRVRQTSGGTTTDYAIDRAGGLTQVLADNQHTYLYGNGRIAQHRAGGMDYFLGDALGSVRQLVDGNGNITLTKGYEPYGELIDSAGNGATSYGFTGEITDPTGLMYLRARYYASWQGRFISRDIWDGNYYFPMSSNFWLYGYANPLKFVDPTGYYSYDVHHDLTLALGKDLAAGFPIIDPVRIATLIAESDNAVDTLNLLMPVGGCSSCHFMPYDRTIQHIEEAILSRKPYLFGASLHQLQDYYTHWREGYHNQTLGHGMHTLLPRNEMKLQDFYSGGHYETAYGYPIWKGSPYLAHPYGETLQNVRRRNPQIVEIPGENWDMIDLYLRLDGEDAGASEQYALRDYFGFKPDKYFKGSRRDIYMTRVTEKYIRQFLGWFAMEKCPDWSSADKHPAEISFLLTK